VGDCKITSRAFLNPLVFMNGASILYLGLAVAKVIIKSIGISTFISFNRRMYLEGSIFLIVSVITASLFCNFRNNLSSHSTDSFLLIMSSTLSYLHSLHNL